MNKHEELMINFVLKNKRERIKQMLTDNKKREMMLRQMAYGNFFDPSVIMELPKKSNRDFIFYQLKNKGASESCYIVSENNDLDGKIFALFQVLEAVIGYEYATLVSCIPGKLGYFEGEGIRYILISEK